MKTLLHINKLFKLDYTWSKKLTLFLVFSLLFTGLSFAQVTENYQMQTGNFNQSFTEKNTSPPFAGTFDNGSSEIGQFANNGSFGNTPGAAVFRTFTIDGFDENATARPLEVGDEFVITVFSSTNPSTGGRIGISFRNSTTYTDFFSSTDANTVARFQIDDLGGWKIYHGTGITENSSATSNTDRQLRIKITSSNTFNATIAGVTYHDLSFDATGSIRSFSIYTFGDSNPDSFWKDASLTSTNSVEIGASNTSFTLSGDINDGLDANSSSTVSVNNLTKNGTGTITLSGANTFTGTTTINGGVLEIAATGSLSTSSQVTVQNGAELVIRNNQELDELIVDAGGTVRVLPGAVLKVNTTLTNNGTIIFESDANGSGQFDEFTGTLTSPSSGDFTVERYIPAERAFRLLASPVTTSGTIFDNWQEGGIYPTSANNIGTHITGVQGTVGQFDTATGLDQTASGNSSMFTFDNAHIDPLSGTDQSGAWEAVTSTNQTGDNLNAETPYLLFVRGDRSIDLSSNSSTPTNTTLNATGTLFTNSTSTQSLSDQPEYFSLVANPFQAIVNFNDLAFTGLGNANFMYVYDPTQKDFETLETGVNNSDMFIRPGQSVFVANTTGTTTASTVEFEKSDINTSANPGTTVFSDDSMATLELELYNDSGELRENLKIRFEANASNAIDAFDAPKLTWTSENLGSVNSGNIYTIERRAPVQDTDQIPLHLDQYQGTDYAFSVNLDNWNTDVEVFVVDDYLGTTTEITPNQAYTFSVDPNIPESIASDRFSLTFNNTTLGVDDNRFDENFSLYPNPTRGQFTIKTPNLSGEVNVEITNLLGQQVYAQKLALESQKVTISTPELSTGIYVVNLKQGHQSFSKKLVVE